MVTAAKDNFDLASRVRDFHYERMNLYGARGVAAAYKDNCERHLQFQPKTEKELLCYESVLKPGLTGLFDLYFFQFPEEAQRVIAEWQEEHQGWKALASLFSDSIAKLRYERARKARK